MSNFQVTSDIKRHRIVTKDLVLVPYERHLVPNYHEWMQNDELCAQTDSIKLSLEEEFEAQKSWMEDESKLTFIVCDLSVYLSVDKNNQQEREMKSMIGDINLFFNQNGDDDYEKQYAELSVMVARTDYRRKGYGLQAILAMLNYVHQTFPTLPAIIAIIGENNAASLKMFQDHLGFKHLKYVRAFKQNKLLFEFANEEQDKCLKNLLENLNFHVEKV